jgi:uncharacterized protein (DUF2267 family)
MELTELESAEFAEHALLIVISAVLRRLTPAEAADFLAQMPANLRDYAMVNVPNGPDLSVRRGAIEAELANLLAVSPQRAAQIVRQVGRALSAGVSRGELSDVIGQLPRDMREIFAGASPAAPS